MIDKHSIDLLKQRCDIVEVIGSYIELRRAGANYSARCPFHEEKTPSFIVSPNRGYFTCFGCGKSGDSVTFVMEKEHLSFYEAVEKLADMYNFTLEYTKEKRDSNIYDYLEQIAKFYQENLNGEIRKYLASRGISEQSIGKFRLGYIGNGTDLMKFLNDKKIPLDSLLEYGIVGKNERGYYAKFYNRVMFPICAPSDKIIGFGGRDLSGNAAKYINSQQSKIFNKSYILYGYNLAREAIFKAKKIIITEGYIDVIMMSQAGFNNVVATLGTALTKDHLPLISRGEVDVILCYDGDSAGINAALKASMLLFNKNGGVVIFSDNKDPADMIAEGKSAEVLNKLNAPIPFIEFIITNLAKKYDLKNPLQKEKALNEALVFYSKLSPILKDEYRGFLASNLNVSPYLIDNAEVRFYESSAKSKSSQANSRNNFYESSSRGKFFESNFGAQNVAQTAELAIIKSILENPPFLDFCLEYLSAEDFLDNKDAFSALVSGEMENPKLIQTLLNDKIVALDFDMFSEQIRKFIITAYERQMREIKGNKTLKSEVKNAKLREIKSKLDLLKSGHLIHLNL